MNRDQYESKLSDYNCEHGYQAVAQAPRTAPAQGVPVANAGQVAETQTRVQRLRQATAACNNRRAERS